MAIGKDTSTLATAAPATAPQHHQVPYRYGVAAVGKNRLLQQDESKRQRKQDKKKKRSTKKDDGSACSSSVMSREGSKLELVMCRRRERELRQRLQDIESEKQQELEAIRGQVATMKQETRNLSLVEQELYFRRLEIESLQKEHTTLLAKNERLALNVRNLRINSHRLHEFARGNRDDYKMLQMHHDRAQDENTKLVAMEQHLKRKVEKLARDIQHGTSFIFAEHRLKQTLRQQTRAAMQRVAQADEEDVELTMNLYALFQPVEKLEEASEQALPFSEHDSPLKVLQKESRRKRKKTKSRQPSSGGTPRTKRSLSLGKRSTSHHDKKKEHGSSSSHIRVHDGHKSSSSSSRKRRSHRQPEDGLHDSWNSV
mmetsp:Transcript_29963/g.62618  ORF Transcript_29963/g.62618 Transcript_29963/m.62618 type:complete len:370 (-) Transcript_29963:159-1268(-)